MSRIDPSKIVDIRCSISASKNLTGEVSRQDLSDASGVNYFTLSRIETGETPDPKVSTVVKIAAGLSRLTGKKVSVEEIMEEAQD